MDAKFHAGEHSLTSEKLYQLALQNGKITLTATARNRLENNRRFLEDKLKAGAVVYGVNTGFGKLCQTRIEPQALQDLQMNLIRSHSCGTGPSLPYPMSRMVLALKLHNLALGVSGVRPVLCEYLLQLWESGWAPVIPMQGSLGASGDLTPLAYLAAVLVGLGSVENERGARLPAGDWLRQENLQPLVLSSKEGLALLNGTQYMAALGAYISARTQKLLPLIWEAYVLSSLAWGAATDPLHPALQARRPHPGQIRVAAACRALWPDMAQKLRSEDRVQDPYSFRCMPQVAGASLDVLDFVNRIVQIELNSVTDNPLVLDEEDVLISGGHFHGQPLALAFDMAAIALAELAAISERRQFRLLSGKSGLPAFLADDPGLQSGYMIVQYTAAALVSHNKQLCTPASVDSLESSDGQEDHVSMGANAANKLLQVWDNLCRVIAYEWLVATRACLFRTGGDSKIIELMPHGKAFLQAAPPHKGDVWMDARLRAAEKFIQDATL